MPFRPSEQPWLHPPPHTHRNTHTHKANLHTFLTTLVFLFLPHPLFHLSRLALSTSRLNHALPELKLIPQSQAAGTKIRKSIELLAGPHTLTGRGSFPLSFVRGWRLNKAERGVDL